MKIKYWMTPDPIVVAPETLIIDAKKIMKDKQIRRLPVVKNDELVGIVTYRNIIEASPSAATSLSIHELNYLILKLKVEDVMRRDPMTFSPDDSVIDAMLEGRKRGIGSFPIIDKGRLVGIVTESEIINAMNSVFGNRAESEIIHLENLNPEESLNGFRKIAEIAEKQGIPLLGIFTFQRSGTSDYQVLLRVKTKRTESLVEAIKDAGYTVAA